MEKKDYIQYWLTSAAHDLETTEALFEKNKGALPLAIDADIKNWWKLSLSFLPGTI
ncbi:MAG: hypothetical protein ONB05_09880 [candidate division KSB1 bacterium]|nr:hypothetical protein [candidate division KSB1 bacterium]